MRKSKAMYDNRERRREAARKQTVIQVNTNETLQSEHRHEGVTPGRGRSGVPVVETE